MIVVFEVFQMARKVFELYFSSFEFRKYIELFSIYTKKMEKEEVDEEKNKSHIQK